MSMSARKSINKNHPDFEEYMEKCRDIQKRYIAEDEAVEKAGRAKYPDWSGKDSPWGMETRRVQRKYNAELKALQEEYSHLFTEDIGIREE